MENTLIPKHPVLCICTRAPLQDFRVLDNTFKCAKQLTKPVNRNNMMKLLSARCCLVPDNGQSDTNVKRIPGTLGKVQLFVALCVSWRAYCSGIGGSLDGVTKGAIRLTGLAAATLKLREDAEQRLPRAPLLCLDTGQCVTVACCVHNMYS